MKHIIQENPPGNDKVRHLALQETVAVDPQGGRTLYVSLIVNGQPLISHIPAGPLHQSLTDLIEETKDGES